MLLMIGKQVIHPTQVSLAHECFAPSEVKVNWATELIEAFEKHKQQGKVSNILCKQVQADLFFLVQ